MVGDVGAAAALIRDARARHMDVVVGPGTRVGPEGVVGASWATGGTRFSAQHAVIAETEDRVVGLLIGRMGPSRRPQPAPPVG